MSEKGIVSRSILFAAIVAGASYLIAVATQMTGAPIIAWKGAGVGLLALYAALQAKTLDGWLVTGVMAFGAAGDVLLDSHGMTTGGAVFFVGHCVAIFLYGRNQRAARSASQTLLASVVVIATPLIAWLITASFEISFYAAIIGVMAVAAWTSRFSRYRVGIGAMLFLVSDLLIFARMGMFFGQLWVSIAIWTLYFSGQLLITLGATQRIARDPS